MDSWIANLKYIVLGLFLAASLTATGYEWWYVWPVKRCDNAGAACNRRGCAGRANGAHSVRNFIARQPYWSPTAPTTALPKSTPQSKPCALRLILF